jgi:hypothetical protein
MAEEIWCKRQPRAEELPVMARHKYEDTRPPTEIKLISVTPDGGYRGISKGELVHWSWCPNGCEWLRHE